MALIDLTMSTFEPTINENEIVLIDFWADWCGPCKQFAPIYEKLAEKYPKIVFGKVNTEVEQDLAGMFGVSSIPTLAILRQGILLYKEAGVIPEQQLDSVIEQVTGLDMDDVRRQVAEQEAGAGEQSGGGCGCGSGGGGCGSSDGGEHEHKHKHDEDHECCGGGCH